jgi:hypothetical protein
MLEVTHDTVERVIWFRFWSVGRVAVYKYFSRRIDPSSSNRIET